ncbi:MAG TPA: hypothetical protein VHG72_17035 [Polyangia bacterium]|nr:hypothetical protein [Polyangia bacterium]
MLWREPRPDIRYDPGIRLTTITLASGLVLAGGTGAAGSLAGAWWFGSDGPEPKDAVISVPQRCWNGGVDFTLRETGRRLTGKVRWIEPTGGVPRPPRDETETLTGTRDGNHIVLVGEHTVVTYASPYTSLPGDGSGENSKTSVKYDLRLEPNSGHLVGTRDGRPLWLTRFKTTPTNCGSRPP